MKKLVAGLIVFVILLLVLEILGVRTNFVAVIFGKLAQAFLKVIKDNREFFIVIILVLVIYILFQNQQN